MAKVRPMDFGAAAKHACKTTLKDAKSTYPKVEEYNLPYLCMDLVYQYSLLVDGFGKLCQHLLYKSLMPQFLIWVKIFVFGN